MIQRLVLYATLGTLCSALGHEWSSAEFWCIVGLTWAGDVLGRHDGYQAGLADSQRTLALASRLLEQAQQLEALTRKDKDNNNETAI
jgi:hypothetical protein